MSIVRHNSQQHPYGLYVATLALALFGYREWITLSKPILLFFDEAYYYGWSQQLDWGYYSKPPVVAWLIRLTTDLFGNAEWAIKLASPVLYSLTGGVLYAIGKRLAGAQAGFYSAVIFLTMPLVSFNSLFITTDAPLLFLWSSALWLFLSAQATNRWHFWILAGLVGGLGLLSKYTFVLFPAAFLLYGMLSQQGRNILTNARFWVTCALALACLLPNLWWNYNHDFISFQHTAEISQQTENEMNIGRLLEFWGTQFIVFGPVAMLLLGVRLFKPRSVARGHQEALLWSLFIPIFAVISIQALSARANINWGAPAFVSASLIVGIYLAKLRWKIWFKVLTAVNLVLMFAFYNYASLLSVLNIESKEGNDPFVRIEGWKPLAHSIQPIFDQYPDAPLASDSRKVLAYFGYYLEPKHLNGRALNPDKHIKNQYELLYPIETSASDTHLFVSEHMSGEQLKGYFESVQLLDTANAEVRSNMTRSVKVYRVSGFKGY